MSLDTLLAGLPEIFFCELDPEQIESRAFAVYEQITERKLYPGNPERLFLEALVAIIVQQRVIIDHTGKMNLLAYASGGYLEHLGALVNTCRLPAQPALVRLRFELDAPLDFVVPVPLGTRVTPDGQLFFATLNLAEIPAGETFIETDAACSVSGESGNGFVPGQINLFVDPLAYVARVRNVSTSNSGADIESDSRLRERVSLAPEAFSSAGPVDAYRYHALSVHPNIIDVAAVCQEPGQVDIYPLMLGGDLPDREIMNEIARVLAESKTRPLTDIVRIKEPEGVPYDLHLTWFVQKDQAALLAQITRSVEAALKDYLLWQRCKMGRDLNTTKLISMLETAGAKRVDLHSPDFTRLEPWQVARENSVVINYGGLEDE